MTFLSWDLKSFISCLISTYYMEGTQCEDLLIADMGLMEKILPYHETLSKEQLLFCSVLLLKFSSRRGGKPARGLGLCCFIWLVAGPMFECAPIEKQNQVPQVAGGSKSQRKLSKQVPSLSWFLF